jgi:hypothetical protein
MLRHNLVEALVHFGSRSERAYRCKAIPASSTRAARKSKKAAGTGRDHASLARLFQEKFIGTLIQVEIRHVLVESAKSRTGGGERQQASQIPT